MANLDVVGRADVYRYGWQPLAYEAGALLARAGVSPTAQMIAGNVLGAAGLALLIGLLADLAGAGRAAIALAALVVLAMPELWVTCLYFNTTAVGLPFFVGALLLLHRCRSDCAYPLLGGIAAGALFAAACLLRADFATAEPLALLLIARWSPAPFRFGIGFLGVQGSMVLTLLAAQPQFPALVIGVLDTFGTESFPSWSFGQGMRVFIAACAPMLIIGPLLAWRSARPAADWLAGLQLSALAVLPTLAPAVRLYSGKYLVIFFVCILILAADTIGRLAGSRSILLSNRRLIVGWSVLVVLVVAGFPRLEALRHDPLAAPFSSPALVHSHDGPRTVGAYAYLAAMLRAEESPAGWIELLRMSEKALKRCHGEIHLMLPRSAWYWGNLLGILDISGWRLLAYHFPVYAVVQSVDGRSTLRIASMTPQPAGRAVLDYSMLDTDDPAWLADALSRARGAVADNRCPAASDR